MSEENAESMLKKLVDTVLELKERMDNIESKLENGEQTAERARRKLPITLKQGNKGFLMFLNSYRMVRNNPMIILNEEQLLQLRSEIDKLLSVKTAKGKKVEQKEGFEEAIEE